MRRDLFEWYSIRVVCAKNYTPYMENYNSGHPWDTTSWLLLRGGLFIQWNLYIVVTLGIQPVGR